MQDFPYLTPPLCGPFTHDITGNLGVYIMEPLYFNKFNWKEQEIG